MLNPSRAVLALGVGLALAPLAAAHAQGGPAPLAAPPAQVDPKARAVLDAMIVAYKSLKSYSATVSVETSGGQTHRQTITLAFRRPGSARVRMSDEAGPVVEAVTDGTSLFLLSARDKQYVKQPAPPGSAIPAALSQARGALLPTLAGSPEFLSRLFTQPGITASLGAPRIVGGVPTDTVTATLPDAPGSRIVFTFSVAAGDHLLRQLVEAARFSQGGKTQSLRHTETVTSQTLDPALTASDFVFVPPPGAKRYTEPAKYDPRLKPGARPFAIAATDLSGRPLSLAQYQGKVVLLDFWATWCGPCVGEMPDVIAAYKKYHAQGFDVVGISLDQDKGALTSFLRRNRMPWRQVFDGKGWGSAVPLRYGVMEIPFGLLLNRDGTIAAVEAGGDALPAAIQTALAKK